MSIKHLYLIAVAVILGCAPASGTSDTSVAGIVPRRGNYLSGEEILEAKADVGTAHDAVSRLRPSWLASHGPTSFGADGSGFALVFVEGQHYGDLASLRNIPAYHVAGMRYYNVTEAGAAYGLRGGNSGVIEVRMKVRE
jgi:hypothetical protein